MSNQIDPNSGSSSMPSFEMPSFSPPPFSSQMPGQTKMGQNRTNLQSPLALGAPTKKAGFGASAPGKWVREHDEPDPPTKAEGPSNPVNPGSGFIFGGVTPQPDGSLEITDIKTLGPPYNQWWDQIWTYTCPPLTPAQQQQLEADAKNPNMNIQQALSGLNLTWTCKSAENNLLRVPPAPYFKEWFPREYAKFMYTIALGIAEQTRTQMQQAANDLKKSWAKMAQS